MNVITLFTRKRAYLNMLKKLFYEDKIPIELLELLIKDEMETFK